VTPLSRIQNKVRERDYYLSSHAEEEMAEDSLESEDVEHALLNGKIEKRLTHDPRGTRFRIEGPVRDGRTIHVVCRFVDPELLVITVYAL